MRSSNALVDLTALYDNYSALSQLISNQLIVVVKANAYGHGLSEVVTFLSKKGVTYFATAFVDEAIAIKEISNNLRVLNLGSLTETEIEQAISFDIELVAYSVESLNQIYSKSSSNKKTKVHLKFDTGMGRLGFWHDQFKDTFDLISKFSDKLELIGVCTHFSSAEDSLAKTNLQNNRFDTILNFAKQNYPKIEIHAANSAAAILYPDTRYNFCRVGMALYGIQCDEYILPEEVKLVLQIKSTLTSIKKIPKGETISYSGTYRLKEDSYIGVVPIGYGDGFSRRLSNSGKVLINDKFYPIVGNICMDQFMVLLGQDYYDVGQQVTLLGTDNKHKISSADIARWARISPYEVTTCLLPRVNRIYII
jgi:alanine racemase